MTKQAVNRRILANVYQWYIVMLLHIMTRYSIWVAVMSVQFALGFPGLLLTHVANLIASLWRLHRPPLRTQHDEGYTTTPKEYATRMPRECDTYNSIVQHETTRCVTYIRADRYDKMRYDAPRKYESLRSDPLRSLPVELAWNYAECDCCCTYFIL